MKVLSLALLIFFSNSCYSQTSKDSVWTPEQLTAGMKAMKLNLRKHSKEFRTGLIIEGAGFVLTGIGLAVPGRTPSTQDKEDTGIRNLLFVAGGFSTLVGAIIMLDSHKHIGRAGKWKFNGNSVVYNLN